MDTHFPFARAADAEYIGPIRFRLLSRCLVLLPVLVSATCLFGQNTNISIGNAPIQAGVKRLGINLGGVDNWDSGQILKNLTALNPGFEPTIWHSTVRCAGGSTTTCLDQNIYSAWGTNFWTSGATIQVITGAASGCSTSLSNYVRPSASGSGTYTFASACPAPIGSGDYLIIGQAADSTLNPTFGYWPSTSGNGTFSLDTVDLPPGTTGVQALTVNAPTLGDSCSLSSFFDTNSNGRSFLNLNGSYQISFAAKGLAGSQQVQVSFSRGTQKYLSQTITLTPSWANYTANFTASETGSQSGYGQLTFSTVGADKFYIDNVALTEQGSSGNPTVFRDAVVSTLQKLSPGIIRMWDGVGLGNTLDNMLVDQFGRSPVNYGAYASRFYHPISYSVPEFLQLVQVVGNQAEPWMVIPITMSPAEASNLIDYLSGDSTTVYGAKRIAQGFAVPWTQIFPKIHLEFGNEAWNSTFDGGNIKDPALYGARAQTIFAAMKANGNYDSSHTSLVLGGFFADSNYVQITQNNCNNNDEMDVAPYMMNSPDDTASVTNLFHATLAEPQAYFANGTTYPGVTAESIGSGYFNVAGRPQGVQGGGMYLDLLAESNSTHPVPVSVYEENLSPTGGVISQAVLNSFVSTMGAGLATVSEELMGIQNGVLNQNVFSLTQFNFSRGDGSSVYLWGSVVDMGGPTNLLRPQYLVEQLANSAISPGGVMLPTTQTGDNPTWNQFLDNSVAMNGVNYLQSFAFSDGSSSSSVVLLNLSLDSSLPVTFSGSNAPGGTVQMQQLTAANVTDTNEAGNLVHTSSSVMNSFSSSTVLSLPPYSMTVLTWNGATNPTPTISSVAATGLTGTSGTITWTTDQAASSLVNYGTTASYGSASTLNSTMVTSHSVTLSGLTPGTTYNYAAVSANAAGLSAASANLIFQTKAQVPVISSVTTSGVTGTSVTITWNTDQASSSLVSYGTTTAYGSASPLNSALVTSHFVTLTGLTPGTTYNYAAVSANSAGLSATSPNFTFNTNAQAPVISSVTASGIAATSATITWTTDQASSSLVNYGTTAAYGSASTVNSTLSTSHSVTITGLTAGTTYNYAAISANSAGTSATSANFTFKTTAQAPVISAVTATGIGSASATITWTTDQASSSSVNYGTTSAYGSTSPSNLTLLTSHSVTLTGLTAGTTYNYAAVSTNSAGMSATSSNFTFVTPNGNATYGGLDTTTQGAWTASYGADGYFIPNYANSAPAYAAVSLIGQSTWTWAPATSDPRALQTSTGIGLASTYYANSFSIKVNFTDGNAHRIALYLLDWDTTSRAETISILDASTRAVLNTQTFSNFHSGEYASWALSGNVIIQVTVTGGANAVVSGIFFGPAPVSTSSAAYTGVDTRTQGTWTEGYGADGYLIANGATNAPAYAAVNFSGASTWTWDQATSDPRALQVSNGSSTRIASTYYASKFAVNVNLTDGNTHKVALYLLDWDTTSRVQTISILDAATRAILSTQTFSSFNNGQYASWNIKGNVIIQVTMTGGQNAVISGIFFGGAPVRPPTISAVAASNITGTSATISWTTDQASSSLVNYGIGSSFSLFSVPDSNTVISHSVVLTSLTPGTTYNYYVVSVNPTGGSANSANLSFTTPTLSTVGPNITNVTFWAITASSAWVHWSTDVPSTSSLAYGLTSALGQTTVLQKVNTTSHTVVVGNLSAGTTYYLVAKSTDTSGNTSSSSVYSFTTNVAPNATAQ